MSSPRKFRVTRTKNNEQMGLTVLIESLELGETKEFVSAADIIDLERKLVEWKELGSRFVTFCLQGSPDKRTRELFLDEIEKLESK